VREVPLDTHGIGAIRGGESLGSKTPTPDLLGQGLRSLIDKAVHPGILIGVCLVRPIPNPGHNLRVHGYGKGQGESEALSRRIQGS
jgi:hypothetical protein